ncbi:MAG TPA: PepSY domain-containing protein, partial [Pseudomonas sp.]|nr:PepSY domain-containing protein [Pseudomonas sp.]
MKRYLYLWHRWLGIGLCLVMALWFVSGVVMLYVGYPKLTPGERLRHLPELPADCCTALDA